MVVPNAVHYVYGLKPVPEGQKPEELPYYAYLAMRSAMINLKPEKVFLYVGEHSNWESADTKSLRAFTDRPMVGSYRDELDLGEDSCTRYIPWEEAQALCSQGGCLETASDEVFGGDLPRYRHVCVSHSQTHVIVQG